MVGDRYFIGGLFFFQDKSTVGDRYFISHTFERYFIGGLFLFRISQWWAIAMGACHFCK